MFQVGPVASAADRDAHGGIRHEVYVEEQGWLPAAQVPIEFDALDQQATLVLARAADGRPVGSARVIHQGPLPLPVQLTPFNVELDPTRRAVEISRLAVRTEHRGDPDLLAAMFGCILQVVCDASADDVYALVEPPLLATAQAFGFPFLPLQEPLYHFGGMIQPVLLVMTAPALPAQRDGSAHLSADGPPARQGAPA